MVRRQALVPAAPLGGISRFQRAGFARRPFAACRLSPLCFAFAAIAIATPPSLWRLHFAPPPLADLLRRVPGRWAFQHFVHLLLFNICE